MRGRILHRVPLSRLLIISYLGLLISVAGIRFTEYKQTREAGNRINIVAKNTNQKLRLLTSMRKNSDSLQVLGLQFFFKPENNKIKEAEKLIKKTISYNDSSFTAYDKLVETDEEKNLFSSLREFNSNNNIMIDSLRLLSFTDSSKYEEVHSFIARQKNVFDGFHNTNHELSDLVSAESEKQINDINQYVFRLAWRKEISSYIIIFLLAILALTIGNTLRKLRRTENKYRLLFDHGPLPKYFVDPKTFRILKVNRAAIKEYGYDQNEFLKMTVFNLCRSDEQKQDIINKWMSLKPGDQFETKARHYKKNGAVMVVEVRVGIVQLQDKKVFLAVANDVTEKEELENEVTKAIIKTQEQERSEIGSELHDNVCQLLASSQMYLDMIRDTSNSREVTLRNEAKKFVDLAVTEIRNLSHRITPSFIKDEPFANTINGLLDEMNADKKFRLRYQHDKEFSETEIPNDIKLNLYRILQEQLKNIRKYSNASLVKVTLRLKNKSIRMLIYDDGVGFNIETVKKGIGLINMRKRAESFSGTFTIDSSQNNGCTILVEIPLIEKARA